MKELSRRRLETQQRIENLRGELARTAAEIQEKACVYVTGSFGRNEAGQHSDLDLFIIGARNGDPGSNDKNTLRRLDEICLKADLIRTTKKLSLPDFDGDGKYLSRHSVQNLLKTLGQPQDDALNTFTARLLLLLESKPLIGENIYRNSINDIIAAYWEDYEDHAGNFIPAFLANDILRLWRTFCVNYEAFTERQPEDKKLKRKLKNYKLKHSRLLTCYSGLIFLLAKHNLERTVTPKDAQEMTGLTPTQRLEWILEIGAFESAHQPVRAALENYERFLERTSPRESDFLKQFQTEGFAKQLANESSEFGNNVYLALNAVGRESDFHRLIVV